MRGAVGVDFGKMKGKRVERTRRDSMSPGTAVQDKDKGAGSVAGGTAADGVKKSDRWREKSVGGE